MALLREILRLHLTAPSNNIGSCLFMMVCVKICLETASWIRIRGGSKAAAAESRAFVHVALPTCCLLCWPLFDTTDWSWRLNAIVPAVMMTRMFYKGLFRKDPDDEDVQIMSRTGSPSDLAFGPCQLSLLLLYLGLFRFKTVEAAVMLAAVGIGDGLAPPIGRHHGRHVYRMIMALPKTMEGTIVGVFLGTVAGCYLYLWMLGLGILPLRIILAYAAIAAFVEGTAPASLDNLMVPIVLHLSFPIVDEWLPA